MGRVHHAVSDWCTEPAPASRPVMAIPAPGDHPAVWCKFLALEFTFAESAFEELDRNPDPPEHDSTLALLTDKLAGIEAITSGGLAPAFLYRRHFPHIRAATAPGFAMQLALMANGAQFASEAAEGLDGTHPAENGWVRQSVIKKIERARKCVHLTFASTRFDLLDKAPYAPPVLSDEWRVGLKYDGRAVVWH